MEYFVFGQFSANRTNGTNAFRGTKKFVSQVSKSNFSSNVVGWIQVERNQIDSPIR
jgi:hypothetical protein